MSLAASALFFALFARVRGRGILRTSPVRGSRFPLGEGFLTPETLAAVATELPCHVRGPRGTRGGGGGRRGVGSRYNQGSRTNTEEGERRWDLWRNEAHSGGGRGRPTGPWRACSGVARSSRAGLGRRKILVAARNRPKLRLLLPPRLRTNPSTWASSNGSLSSGIRASSPTRTSKPRRSSCSVSERRVCRRGEHLGRGDALRPSFMPLFIGVRGIGFLRSSLAGSWIRPRNSPARCPGSALSALEAVRII